MYSMIKSILTRRRSRLSATAGLSTLFIVFACTTFCFSLASCSDDKPNEDTTEKVILMFGIDQGIGELRVYVKGQETPGNELTSWAELPKGTEVVCKAIHSKEWQVKYWKINGEIIRSVEPEQTFTINRHFDIRLALKSFMPIPIDTTEE